jgi:hypothetical protein
MTASKFGWRKNGIEMRASLWQSTGLRARCRVDAQRPALAAEEPAAAEEVDDRDEPVDDDGRNGDRHGSSFGARRVVRRWSRCEAAFRG